MENEKLRIPLALVIALSAAALALILMWTLLRAETPACAEESMHADSYGPGQYPVEHMELVGQIGGETYTADVQGDYAYVGVGPRVLILDISDPTNPTLLSQTEVMVGVVRAVEVEGNHAYVAALAFYVFDISDPAHPVKLGETEDWMGTEAGEGADIAVDGGYAYVANHDLYVIDVSNPHDPSIAKEYFVGIDDATGVAISGTHAYVSDLDKLHVFSTTNPMALTEVGYYETPGGALGVAISSTYAYVAEGWDWSSGKGGGLRILDISNPMSPTNVCLCGDLGDGNALGVAVSGDYAYFVGVGWLYIFNISDPKNPTGAGYDIDSALYPDGLTVKGSYVYTWDKQKGLSLVNVADAGNPVEDGAYYTSVPGEAKNVTVAGNYAYLANDSTGLRIVDVSNPAQPVEVSSLAGINGHGLDVVGNYAYAGTGSGLRIVDISDPANPTTVGSHSTPTSRQRDVAVEEEYAYIPWARTSVGDGGLDIVDVSDPVSPAQVSVYTPTEHVSHVAALAGHAYIAEKRVVTFGGEKPGGLRIVDVSDPLSPTHASFYEIHDKFGVNDSAWGLDIAGDFAYIAGQSRSLYIIDVSVPSNPQDVVEYTYIPMGWAHSVAVDGDYAYVGGFPGGINVFDISTPTMPTKVGFHWTPGTEKDIALANGYIYVADDECGLMILWFGLSHAHSVPSGGGAFTFSDGTSYTFPVDTFTDTVVFTYTPRAPANIVPPGGLVNIGHAFEATATYASTGQPAQPAPGQTYTLTVQYAQSELGVAIEDTLALYHWDDNQWVKEPGSQVNTLSHTVTATPDHFSLWAVFGETRRVFLPLTLRQYP